MLKKYSVAVGILHVNEKSLASCLSSVQNQKNVDTRHAVFSGHPNQEANTLLYQYFNRQQTRVEARARVDADMVLTNARVFASSCLAFEKYPGLDRITFPLHDELLGYEIYGLHLWSRNVRWATRGLPSLRVDLAPENVRRTIVLPRGAVEVGIHAPDRTSRDACVFVTRRAVKVAEVGVKSPHVSLLKSIINTSAVSGAQFRHEVIGSLVQTAEDPESAIRAVQNPDQMQAWADAAADCGRQRDTDDALQALEVISRARYRADTRWNRSWELVQKVGLRRGRAKRDISETKEGFKMLTQIIDELEQSAP